jgi:hypothetical protein
MSEFYKYDFKTFIEELEKQNIKLNLKQSEEWENYFISHSNDLKPALKRIIEATEQLNNLVYKAYNLSSDEIDLLKNSD